MSPRPRSARTGAHRLAGAASSTYKRNRVRRVRRRELRSASVKRRQHGQAAHRTEAKLSALEREGYADLPATWCRGAPAEQAADEAAYIEELRRDPITLQNGRQAGGGQIETSLNPMTGIDTQGAGHLRVQAALSERRIFEGERSARETPPIEHLRNRGAADRISLCDLSAGLQCGGRAYPGGILEIR